MQCDALLSEYIEGLGKDSGPGCFLEGQRSILVLTVSVGNRVPSRGSRLEMCRNVKVKKNCEYDLMETVARFHFSWAFQALA